MVIALFQQHVFVAVDTVWVLLFEQSKITFCPIFQNDDLWLSSSFKLKALFCEYIATCSVAERQYGSTYRHITQEVSVILLYELLIYQHSIIRV